MQLFLSSGTSTSGAGVCPWVGYENEEDLKAQILALSEDKRTFIRSPPSGVKFDFDPDRSASTALALLEEDERLEKMRSNLRNEEFLSGLFFLIFLLLSFRYELVPKKVKESMFWRNYFYRVSLIQQSYELKDLVDMKGQKKKSLKDEKKSAKEDAENNHDQNDS